MVFCYLGYLKGAMNVGQTVEGHTLSPLGSQDSAITSTSVNNDQSLGSPVSKATDGASSSRQVVSESEVSSTSVSGSTSWSLPSASEVKEKSTLIKLKQSRPISKIRPNYPQVSQNFISYTCYIGWWFPPDTPVPTVKLAFLRCFTSLIL